MMKRAYLLAIVIIALGISAFGQSQGSADPEPTKAKNYTGGSEKGNKGSGTKKSGPTDTKKDSPLILAGTNLQAELQSMIDVRKSNVGDQVVLKTTQAIKQNGEVIVPKGTKLIGRITEVKRKTKDDTNSKVGMVFDRLQGKDLDIPVNVSLVTVTAARATAAAGDIFGADLAGSGSASGSASARRASSSTGGGLLGGGGGLLGGVTSTAGSVVNTTTSTVGNVAGSAVNTVGGTAGTVGRTVNGLQISQSASGSANSSSTISAKGKDVRIEKGASFHLRLDGAVDGQE